MHTRFAGSVPVSVFFIALAIQCGISCSDRKSGISGDQLPASGGPPALLTEIRQCRDRAVEWLAANFKNGLFTYDYDPFRTVNSGSNNAIRQLMASAIFADLAHTSDTYMTVHTDNLTYILSHWYKEDEENGYILYNGGAKLGAAAFALITVVRSPLYDDYRGIARKLCNTILHLQNPDGSFKPWYVRPPVRRAEDDYLLTFYSGEAIRALIEYYRKTNDDAVLNRAMLSQDFYIRKYVDEREEYYYPAYVPWHTQSMAMLYKITGGRKYVQPVFTLNDELLKILDTAGETHSGHTGRFYNPDFPQYGSPHSASDAVYTEGLVYAYEIAVMTGDKTHAEKYAQALGYAVRNLLDLQYTEKDSTIYPYPERYVGAVRVKYADPAVRIDCAQHTIDAFNKILDVFAENTSRKQQQRD